MHSASVDSADATVVSLHERQLRVMEGILREDPLPELLAQLCQIVEQECESNVRAAVMLVDESGSRLMHGAAPSLPDEYNQAVNGILIDRDVGTCPAAAARNEVVVTPDFRVCPRWVGLDHLPSQAGLAGAWSMPIRDSNGSVLGTFGTYFTKSRRPTRAEIDLVETCVRTAAIAIARRRDQVRRNESDRALADSRSRLDYAVRLSGIGFWYCDLPFDELIWDECVKEHFWLPPKSRVTIKTFYERIHPEDQERVRQAIDSSILERTAYDICYRTVDPKAGAVKWIRALGGTAYGNDGAPKLFDGVTIDITIHKNGEQALKTLAARLQTIIDTIPTGLMILDEKGAFTLQNDEWRRTWGESDVVSSGVGYEGYKGFCPKTGKRIAATEWPCAVSLMQGTATRDMVLDIERFNGTRGTIVVSSSPLQDETGHVVGAVAATMDISELRAAQSHLQEADRRKDEFLAMLAHELRNPLAPIGTAAHILKQSQTDTANVIRSAEVIERQVGHLTGLVDDLLDVSRVTRGLVMIDREAVDLRSVVPAAVEQVQSLLRARRHELITSVASGELFVEGDFNRLVQVLTNLITNAAKYTPQNGRIALQISSADGQAIVSVSDNGVGIRSDMLQEVFELFTQAERTPDRAQGGLGIGLALVRSLVSLHGGTVEAYSAGVNLGSTFTVRLPLGSAPIRFPPQPLQSAVSQCLRILLVDDNIDAANSLAELLSLLGHEVVIAHDGSSALETAAAGGWDAYILDIGLPDITGLELVRLLKTSSAIPDATFIALTGYGQTHDYLMSKAAGFDHHIVKPANIGELTSLLARQEH